MQHDVETILITQGLVLPKQQLKSLASQNADIRSQLLSMSNAVKGTDRFGKIAVNILNLNEAKLAQTSAHFDLLTSQGQELEKNDKNKRAFKILGSILSTITGVPSPRDHHDHQIVLDKIHSLRSDYKGVEGMLGSLNNQNKGILANLHFHETDLMNLHKDNLELMKNQQISKDRIMKTLALLSMLLKADLAISKIESLIDKCFYILQASDAEMLSRHAIDPTDLIKIITKIYDSRENSFPLFQKDHVNLYFRLKLAHSWIAKDKSSLTTMLQIPIASRASTMNFHILTMANTLHSNYPFVVTNFDTNTYRYLSQDDYASCQDVDTAMLCQKREKYQSAQKPDALSSRATAKLGQIF